MVKQIEKLAREGNREAAQRMLEQLAQIMENLQMAQPGQSGDSDMEQALNELSDMIRKQQQLRDKTYKQGQDSRRDRSRGKQQGDQSMSDLQQDQQALRDRLKKLQDELAKRGLAQRDRRVRKGSRASKASQGQPGQNGDQDGDQGDDDGSLDDADGAMGDAGSKLGEGNADGAVDLQGKALDALRKGAQKMAEAMQQGDGDGQGDGPGNRAGRQQSGGNQTDPLGRPLHGREFSDDYTVKIPGEIDAQRVRRILEELRRRLGDTFAPADRARLYRAAAEGFLRRIVAAMPPRRVVANPATQEAVWRRLGPGTASRSLQTDLAVGPGLRRDDTGAAAIIASAAAVPDERDIRDSGPACRCAHGAAERPLSLLRRQRIRHRGADVGDRERLGHDVVHQRIEVRGALALVGKAGHQQNGQVGEVARRSERAARCRPSPASGYR